MPRPGTPTSTSRSTRCAAPRGWASRASMCATMLAGADRASSPALQLLYRREQAVTHFSAALERVLIEDVTLRSYVHNQLCMGSGAPGYRRHTLELQLCHPDTMYVWSSTPSIVTMQVGSVPRRRGGHLRGTGLRRRVHHRVSDHTQHGTIPLR